MRSVLAALFFCFLGAPAFAQERPVVVELFTSQGCEPCPRANRMIERIEGEANVIALTYSVDVWDYLGWRDTFARPEFTRRQRAYAHAFRAPRIATPQFVFDGEITEAGAPPERIREVVSSLRAKGAPDIPAISFRHRVNDIVVRVGAGGHRGAPADVWLACFDPGPVYVSIHGGENDGVRVPHYNLVQRLTRLGAWRGAPASYNATGCRRASAVIVQKPNGGDVIGAARSNHQIAHR